MAADILLYDSELVPVGEDQVQHVEVCRDIAGAFNHSFGDVFVLPKAYVVKDTAKVPGLDGGKMSKSYGNAVDVFEEIKTQRKKIMSIVTDSRPLEEPKNPEGDHLFELYSLFASAEQEKSLAETYRRGGFGYGSVKKELVVLAETYFAEARAKREELAAQPAKIREILAEGAEKARKKASEVLSRTQQACGLK
jgi:tryptophanyl-tRNA synthetase